MVISSTLPLKGFPSWSNAVIVIVMGILLGTGITFSVSILMFAPVTFFCSMILRAFVNGLVPSVCT